MKSNKLRLLACISSMIILAGCKSSDVVNMDESAKNEEVGKIEITLPDQNGNAQTDEINDGESAITDNGFFEDLDHYSYGELIKGTTNDSIVVEDNYLVNIEYTGEWIDGGIIVEFAINTKDGKISRSVIIYNDDKCEERYPDYEVPEYRIIIQGYNDGEVEFTFNERVFPEPMVLSGNPEDVYHIDSYQYVIGDKVDLFFDKNIDVCGDYLILVEQVMDELEQLTGLSYDNDSKYAGHADDRTREMYFGFDPWNGYEYFNRNKTALYFVSDLEGEGRIPYCTWNTVVLVDYDFDFHNNSLNSLAHEMAHSLSSANNEVFSNVLSEGFGSYFGRRVSILHPEYISEERWQFGPDREYYFEMNPELDENNAESLYIQRFDRIENPSYYEYGFRLMTYLYENYSVEEINSFYNRVNDKVWEYRLQNNEDTMTLFSRGMLDECELPEVELETLKECFGEDFFIKFGAWVQENAGRFTYER